MKLIIFVYFICECFITVNWGESKRITRKVTDAFSYSYNVTSGASYTILQFSLVILNYRLIDC